MPQRAPSPAPLTYALVALNLLVFAGEAIAAGGKVDHFSDALLLAFGANYSGATIFEHRYDALVTSCFVHGSLIHVGANMLSLYQGGRALEPVIGTARFATLYLVAGIAGSLVSAITGVRIPGEAIVGAKMSVGASGAIFGLFTALIVLHLRLEGTESRAARSMAMWLVMWTIISYQIGGIDNAAHLGGALAGGVIAGLWQRGYVYSARATIGVVTLCAAVVAAGAIALVSRNLHDPLAVLPPSGRLAFIEEAVRQGRCIEARKMAVVFRRAHPGTSASDDVMRFVDEHCGGLLPRGDVM